MGIVAAAGKQQCAHACLDCMHRYEEAALSCREQWKRCPFPFFSLQLLAAQGSFSTSGVQPQSSRRLASLLALQVGVLCKKQLTLPASGKSSKLHVLVGHQASVACSHLRRRPQLMWHSLLSACRQGSRCRRVCEGSWQACSTPFFRPIPPWGSRPVASFLLSCPRHFACVRHPGRGRGPSRAAERQRQQCRTTCQRRPHCAAFGCRRCACWRPADTFRRVPAELPGNHFPWNLAVSCRTSAYLQAHRCIACGTRLATQR